MDMCLPPRNSFDKVLIRRLLVRHGYAMALGIPSIKSLSEGTLRAYGYARATRDSFLKVVIGRAL